MLSLLDQPAGSVAEVHPPQPSLCPSIRARRSGLPISYPTKRVAVRGWRCDLFKTKP
jgi:hypothetical protein